MPSRMSDADHLPPADADVLGQRLARRDAAPQPVRAGLWPDHRIDQQRRVKRRHAAEYAGLAARHDVQHGIRRRPVRQEHRPRADRHREGHRIAQPVGVKRLGGGEHDVGGLDLRAPERHRCPPSRADCRAHAARPLVRPWTPRNTARTLLRPARPRRSVWPDRRRRGIRPVPTARGSSDRGGRGPVRPHDDDFA